MTTKTHRTARFATVLITALTCLAFAAPCAQAARSVDQDCTQTTMASPYAGWVIVNDERRAIQSRGVVHARQFPQRTPRVRTERVRP